jgi:hypothetical protein
VLFKGEITSKNNEINIINSEIEALKTNNSNIFLDDVLVSSVDVDALNLVNSNLKTSNRVESAGVILLTGSDFKTNPESGNEIITKNVIAINVSDILFSNADIDTNGQAIENKGSLNIKNSESIASFKINNYDNSVLNIENSFNTSSPVSVEDINKMSYVSGSTSNISSCVGNIFEDETKLELNELGEVVETTNVKENNAQNWINC